jgi:hypothetical protein
MPTTPYIEKHFTATETVRDIVIGMADRLTVPFALAADLAVNFQEVVHSDQAVNAEVAKHQRFARTEWTRTRMLP